MAARWERLMSLRGTILRSVAPVLAAKQEAEETLYQIRKPFVQKSPVVSKARPVAPVLRGYENSPEWWKEMEVKEREDRKACRIV
jgi:hypothetical protein